MLARARRREVRQAAREVGRRPRLGGAGAWSVGCAERPHAARGKAAGTRRLGGQKAKARCAPVAPHQAEYPARRETRSADRRGAVRGWARGSALVGAALAATRHCAPPVLVRGSDGRAEGRCERAPPPEYPARRETRSADRRGAVKWWARGSALVGAARVGRVTRHCAPPVLGRGSDGRAEDGSAAPCGLLPVHTADHRSRMV